MKYVKINSIGVISRIRHEEERGFLCKHLHITYEEMMAEAELIIPLSSIFSLSYCPGQRHPYLVHITMPDGDLCSHSIPMCEYERLVELLPKQ